MGDVTVTQADQFAELRRVVDLVGVGSLMVDVATLKQLLAHSATASVDGGWPLRARVWTRTSVEPHEKVLEIEGVIDDCHMTTRHTQSMCVADSDVPGLPELYASLSPRPLPLREEVDEAALVKKALSIATYGQPAQIAVQIATNAVRVTVDTLLNREAGA